MRGLITGAKGQLGKALLRLGPTRGWELTGFDIDEVDICNASATEKAVFEAQPDWVFHCAARTDVDGCEKDPDAVFQVNAQGALNVMRGARNASARFMLVSTDFVFPGTAERPYTEDEPVAPPCVYGKTKEAGESMCREEWPEGTWIARTQWLYGPGGKHFVRAIINKARQDGALKVVDDQIGCPTMTHDLALAMFELAEAKAMPGIYHASNNGEASWFEFAGAALQIAGVTGVGIEPISAASLDLPAARPAYSVLCKERLEKAIGHPVRHWRRALTEYLVDLGGAEE